MSPKRERVFSYLRELAENIGDAIEVIVDPYGHTSPFRCGVPRWVRFEGGRDAYYKRRYTCKRYLERKGCIESRRRDDEIYLRFTQKGAVRLLKEKIKITPETLTDTRCLVLFDVPETAKNLRDEFRHFLKNAGFTRIQRSVWASRRDVQPYLEAMCASSGLTEWVRVATTKLETPKQ